MTQPDFTEDQIVAILREQAADAQASMFLILLSIQTICVEHGGEL